MKANELMIGDWVCCTDPTPFKIEAITIIDFPEYVTGNDGFDVEIADLQPIPLTAEILEKNGFTKELYDGVHYRYGIVIDGIGFSVCYVRSVFQWLGPLDFHYVHELQHALRLCGVEKEINL